MTLRASSCAKTTRTSSRRREAAAATATAIKGKGRPSIEALAMADADWTQQHCAFDDDDDDEQGAPPEHLRAFEAFIDAVVPVDMVLAFGREQSARARRGERRLSHQDDVKEKLKLWAKAVAAKARQDVVIEHNKKKNAHAYTVSS